MEKPWKVIVAFIGVFVAGAVFGAFFSMGMGLQFADRHAPAAPSATVSPAVSAPAPLAVTAPPAAQKKGQPAGPVAGQRGTVPFAIQRTNALRRFMDRLGLTPAQRDRIAPMILRAGEDFRRWDFIYAREEGFLLQRLQADIAKELTPDQRTKLQELEDRQREIIQKREAEMQAQKKALTAVPAGGAPTSSTGSGSSTSSGSTSATASTGTASTSESPAPEKKD